MPLTISNTLGQPYGAIPQGYGFELQKGYSVLTGKNNAGKSCFLQLIFRELWALNSPGRDRIALILGDRSYIRNSTQVPYTLEQFNQTLNQNIAPAPKNYAGQQVADSDALYSFLLNRTNFVRQVDEINGYMLRLGFDEIVLKGTQIATINNVHIIAHGAGVRAVLPILAALTSEDISVILIDEPELALEARSQKVLKEIFREAAETGINATNKYVIVATQSHIFLDKQKPEANYIVENTKGVSSLRGVTNKKQLLDITYTMLGNSLEDLFFPSNFLIVEGSSDQVICEKVAELLEIPPERVKIIAARGIDNVEDSFRAIRNTLIPLIVGESPYAKKVVVLVDKPQSQSQATIAELTAQLGERCFILTKDAIEDYLPDDLYARASLQKDVVVSRIAELKRASRNKKNVEEAKELKEYKKSISNSIASVLKQEDLETIPIITDAVKLARDKAS